MRFLTSSVFIVAIASAFAADKTSPLTPPELAKVRTSGVGYVLGPGKDDQSSASRTWQGVIRNQSGLELATVTVDFIVLGEGDRHIHSQRFTFRKFKDMNLPWEGSVLPVAMVTVSQPTRFPWQLVSRMRGMTSRIVSATAYRKPTDLRDPGHLFSLIQMERLQTIKPLILRDPSLMKVVSPGGITPTLMACAQQDPSVIEFFRKQGGNLKGRARNGMGAMHFAALSFGAPAIDSLASRSISVNDKDSFGRSPLHLAAYAGSVESLKALIRHRANIEAPDNAGQRPLLRAIENSQSRTLEALLAAGATLKFHAENGVGPMQAAAFAGSIPILEILLRHGGNVNDFEPKTRWTPLHQAVKFGKVDSQIWLLQHGASTTLKTVNGNTPSMIARKYGGDRGQAYFDALVRKYARRT